MARVRVITPSSAKLKLELAWILHRPEERQNEINFVQTTDNSNNSKEQYLDSAFSNSSVQKTVQVMEEALSNSSWNENTYLDIIGSDEINTWNANSDQQWLNEILTSEESDTSMIPRVEPELNVADIAWLCNDDYPEIILDEDWDKETSLPEELLFKDSSEFIIPEKVKIEDDLTKKSSEMTENKTDEPITNKCYIESIPSTSTARDEAEILDEAKILEECVQIETTPPEKGNRSDSVDFALWALKNLLPERIGLNDKGSILHATADYIEELHGEINANLNQLGTTEETFWSNLQQYFLNKSASNTPKKPVKKEQEQDSNEVKRPPNAFIRFSVEFRRMVAQDFPGRSNRDISQMLGSIWRRMSPEEKEPFVNEFYAELRQTRELHPEWNYAGKNAKRFCLDLGETQPERLRPRHPEQQLSYKNAFRKQKNNKSRKAKKEETNVERVFWIQCDLCNKWRKCPTLHSENTLPEKWNCSLNPDVNHNSCETPEETD